MINTQLHSPNRGRIQRQAISGNKEKACQSTQMENSTLKTPKTQKTQLETQQAFVWTRLCERCQWWRSLLGRQRLYFGTILLGGIKFATCTLLWKTIYYILDGLNRWRTPHCSFQSHSYRIYCMCSQCINAAVTCSDCVVPTDNMYWLPFRRAHFELWYLVAKFVVLNPI